MMDADMFVMAAAFDQDLSSWDVDAVTSFNGMQRLRQCAWMQCDIAV